MIPRDYSRNKPAKKWESNYLRYVHEMRLEVEKRMLLMTGASAMMGNFQQKAA